MQNAILLLGPANVIIVESICQKELEEKVFDPTKTEFRMQLLKKRRKIGEMRAHARSPNNGSSVSIQYSIETVDSIVKRNRTATRYISDGSNPVFLVSRNLRLLLVVNINLMSA